MATQSHKNDAETDDYTLAAYVEREAERVRGMFRDDGVEDPYVVVLGEPDMGSPLRIYVILEDLNMTAVDLLRNPNYRLMGVGEGEVTLIRKFAHTND
jgi:hypothetical protein